MPRTKMVISKRISRRTMLRSLTAAIALPSLDVMASAPIGSGDRIKRINRVGYFYFPNGIPRGIWHPSKVDERGRLQKLNEWMAPLEDHKQDLIIPTEIWTPQGNGHSAGTATWLTGGDYDRRQVSAGGVSVDQLIARKQRDKTLLPSLELSCKGEGFFSNSLPRNTLSWSADGIPLTREVEPRTVFDRMFRPAAGGASDRSVLDSVLSQARALKGWVSQADRQRLEEYLDSIRALEKRIEFAEKQTLRMKADKALTKALRRPEAGIPSDHQEYVQLMMDMIVLAFWSDATRVASFMLDHGQSNRYFNFIDGVQGTWHALSHYGNASGMTEDDDGTTRWDSVETKRAMYAEVVRWHHRQFAYLLGRMKSVEEPQGGTLLDNSMLLYGSSLGDGDAHDENDLPTLIAGGGVGSWRTGRQLRLSGRTDLSAIHLSFLRRMGVERETFGTAVSELSELA